MKTGQLAVPPSSTHPLPTPTAATGGSGFQDKPTPMTAGLNRKMRGMKRIGNVMFDEGRLVALLKQLKPIDLDAQIEDDKSV